MAFFYNISTRFYFWGIYIASLFNKKAALMIRGRRNWRKRLSVQIDKSKKYIWVHCASLGEFEQGRPLIEKLKKEKPDYNIILTFFSPSGYEIRKDYPYADIICYLPFDTKKNAQDFLEIVKPSFAIFVKYEFWYFMIERLFRLNIPYFLICGIFRRNQIFFKPYGKFYLKALGHFSYIFLQDNNSKSILDDFGIYNIGVYGDTRIDRVVQISEQEYENPVLEKFSSSSNTIICGSTWPEDEKIITEFINRHHNTYNYIIVPHEVTEKHIEHIESQINSSVIRYSGIVDNDILNFNVIIIDSIGLLSKLYRYAKLAYIGGGFGKGIHNTLEASVYKIPVLFGPNNKKFKEAQDLLSINSAFCITNYNEFEKIVTELLNDKILLDKVAEKTTSYFMDSYGSTNRIFNKIQQFTFKKEKSQS